MRTYWRKDEEGQWQLLHGPGDEFPGGEVADVAIWSEALTSDEIMALDAGARPPQVAFHKLKRWYPCDALKDKPQDKD